MLRTAIIPLNPPNTTADAPILQMSRSEVSSDLPKAPQVANCGAQLEPSQPPRRACSLSHPPSLPAVAEMNNQKVTVLSVMMVPEGTEPSAFPAGDPMTQQEGPRHLAPHTDSLSRADLPGTPSPTVLFYLSS